MCKRIKDILEIFYSQGAYQITQEQNEQGKLQHNPSDISFAGITKTLLSKLMQTSKDPKYESRGNSYYNSLCQTISVLQPKDLEVL